MARLKIRRMNIHQVSASYLAEQDRLLLRINNGTGEELRFWLTRRLALGLVPLLAAQAGEQMTKATQVNPAAPLEAQRQELVDNFKREAAAYAGDFKTPYQTPTAATATPREPLLVTEATLALMASGQLELKLTEVLGDARREVNIAMPPPLTQGVVQLLQQGINQSGWLNVPAPATGVGTRVDATVMLAGGEKPDYLN